MAYTVFVGAARTVKEALRARLGTVRGELRKSRSTSRTDVAERLCRRLDLRDGRGQSRVGTCLRALRDLEAEGEIELPERQSTLHAAWKPRRLDRPVPRAKEVPPRVDAVVGLVVELVDPSDADGMRTWNELLAREHPQGARLVGTQLRYLVRSDHGVLGAVGFGGCALSLCARERFIGWDKAQQTRFRGRVVQLSRLLIRRGVHCQNLASWVLGACVRRVGRDFEARYGLAPWLLETFVDETKYAGTCFVAAGWARIGETRGRGRNDRGGAFPKSRKGVYVYPLARDFREKMGVPPDRGVYLRPRPIAQGIDPKGFVLQEFGTVELGDQRLRDRLMQIVADRAQNPSVSYLTATGGDRQATKRYYAFLDSERKALTPEAMLKTHRERTTERMMTQRVVLVAQDTTDLNFSDRPETQGLGPIGKNQTGAESLGLRLHSTLALTEEGLPLGVVRSDGYAPPPIEPGKAASPSRPIEEKESFRWIESYRTCVEIARQLPDQTRQIMIMDREADFFELFLEAIPTRHRVGLIVRARTNRRLAESERKLFDVLRTCRDKEEIEVEIPRQRAKNGKKGRPLQPSRRARTATLEVAYRPVTLEPTRKDLREKVKAAGPVTLYALEARERKPPKGAAPIVWRLLTTEPITNKDDAARILAYYAKRWRIEEWHRILKQACATQEHENETAERLLRAIAIDVVLAWRIQLLTLLGRELPDLPADLLFDEGEIAVLERLHPQYYPKTALKEPLRLQHAVVLTARLGGYLDRKSDSPPGAKVLRLGLHTLGAMAVGFELARGPAP